MTCKSKFKGIAKMFLQVVFGYGNRVYLGQLDIDV